jgi:hypothetical protein
MIKIRVINANVSSYQIDKAAGRRNIGLWLESKGILTWSYDMGSNEFIAEVVDNFDLSILEQWGTVEVIPFDS